MADEETPPRTFQFLRNAEDAAAPLVWGEGAQTVRAAISDALNAKNIAFLLGAGCSSLVRDGAELGIPTMAALAREFCAGALAPLADLDPAPVVVVGAAEWDGTSDLPQAGPDDMILRGEDGAEVRLPSPGQVTAGEADPEPELDPAAWRLNVQEQDCMTALGIDLENGYNRNLERLMEVLFAHRFVLRRSENAAHWPQRDLIDSIIAKVQSFLWSRVTEGAFSTGDTTVRDLYEQFYKKLVLRDRALPRPWVFTTNYDVFNETAMDRLGVPYANGFTGVVERRFNPASFRYALAEQLDVGSRKWAAVDAFVYLCKLHGSVTWTEDDHGLFPIRETWPQPDPRRMLIYPTPAKQNAALASPYADLFREFQSRVVREQSVLITVGYAFGDEHINNIIYQALTLPTFRLIIFASPDTPSEIAKLRALRDPRIWIIGGEGPHAGSRAHYFETVIEQFMPERPAERIDEAVRKVLRDMAPAKDDE